MRLRRIIWKQPPSPDLRLAVAIQSMFGPTFFERGNEWLFLYPSKPFICATAPSEDWEQVTHRKAVDDWADRMEA